MVRKTGKYIKIVCELRECKFEVWYEFSEQGTDIYDLKFARSTNQCHVPFAHMKWFDENMQHLSKYRGSYV